MYNGSDPGGVALRAAIQRRDRGERPELWDAQLLHRAREKLNPVPPHEAQLPPGGRLRQLLELLRGVGRPVAVDEAAAHLRLDERQVRDLVDGLRRLHWWIDNTGPKHFQLRRIGWPTRWESVPREAA